MPVRTKVKVLPSQERHATIYSDNQAHTHTHTHTHIYTATTTARMHKLCSRLQVVFKGTKRIVRVPNDWPSFVADVRQKWFVYPATIPTSAALVQGLPTYAPTS